jgi:DNA-directed RNA polymerase subunit beta
MAWSGYNYEDAIVISSKLVKESTLSSIHMEEVVINVRDTKLGPEQTTPDIPNVSENKLKNLDAEGIIRIGAEVKPGDILVGKITPKGETQLTPEERLLRSIFGDKARDVKDTSQRVEGGMQGRIIGVKIFSRENGDKMELKSLTFAQVLERLQQLDDTDIKSMDDLSFIMHNVVLERKKMARVYTLLTYNYL